MSEHDPVVVPFPLHRTRAAELQNHSFAGGYRALQQEGETILTALAHPADASVSAAECVAALRDRGWDGDDTLADTIEARLGKHTDG